MGFIVFIIVSISLIFITLMVKKDWRIVVGHVDTNGNMEKVSFRDIIISAVDMLKSAVGLRKK